jgi:hypothetical protein
MRIHPIDVTAGERARAIAAVPDAPHPIFDPTDPRCLGAAPVRLLPAMRRRSASDTAFRRQTRR